MLHGRSWCERIVLVSREKPYWASTKLMHSLVTLSLCCSQRKCKLNKVLTSRLTCSYICTFEITTHIQQKPPHKKTYSLFQILEAIFLQIMWYLGCFRFSMTAVLILVHLEHSLCESEEVFNWLASEHDRVCYTHATCLKRSTESVESPCCGSCTCEPDCKKLGICCLNQYINLRDARESTENNM